MKIKTSTGRKIRYGGTSIVIVALVIAVVIILNAIMTLLTQKFMWYGDMTPELKFTITEECFELIGEETDNGKNSAIEMVKKFRKENADFNTANPTAVQRDENIKIKILFLLEEDVMSQTDGYIYNNAKELQVRFSDYIELEFTDAMKNPSRFKKYLSSNTDTIDFNSVIIEFGESYQIRNFKTFYLYDNTQGQPYAYNAERAFASSILAVTRAQLPLACYTVGHGESFPKGPGYNLESSTVPFLDTLRNSGYEVRAINLQEEDIPEECKLLITYAPQSDFIESDIASTFVDEKKDEIKKIEKFLQIEKDEDRGGSYMVFLDPSVKNELPVLESFLDEWGLSVRREENREPVLVRDSANSVIGDSSEIFTDYAVNDLMQGWAENLTTPVVFKNAMAIEYAKDYKGLFQPLATDSSKNFSYGYNDSFPPEGRIVYPMFYTREGASGYVNGESVVTSTASDPIMLMAVSTQTFYKKDQMDNITKYISDSSTVLLCGSTDFGSSKYLEEAIESFGNSNMLMSAFQLSGREPVPTNLGTKQFANYNIESISARAATVYTVVLSLAPIAIASLAGVIVLVRRKNK